eukprot:TRINITY_DN2783_c0_g1_i4.p1 TRINITY_DN2783_c0_g1~~TRINITY_DN2783_c0_g1_i4.p1  ORF type:complete len:112 (+),score=6.07 TRINITY_DN2783_c0_g1_i4:171-506(+)
MFHGMHAISKEFAPQVPGLSVDPNDCGGIEVIEADGFKFFCFESATGIKFLCSTEPSVHNATNFLESVYILYSDYVLKNPFYEVDQFGIGQPIRVDRFDIKLDSLIKEWNP